MRTTFIRRNLDQPLVKGIIMEIGQFILDHLKAFQLVLVLLSLAGTLALISLYNVFVALGKIVREKYRNVAKANAEQGDATLALDNR
jgi:hypothetical protein